MLSDFIKDILHDKSGKLLDIPENEVQFNPYIIQRILSMGSISLNNNLNNTTNKKLSFITKKQFYQLITLMTPKSKNYFNKYIKKDKIDFSFSDDEEKAIEFISLKNKTSNKEVKNYIKELDLNLDKIVKRIS